jgi:hypothetical protein
MFFIYNWIKNEIIFDKNTYKKIDSKFILNSFWNHGACHWVYIKLNIKFGKLWINKSKEQVFLNLISQYGVQNTFSFKNLMK